LVATVILGNSDSYTGGTTVEAGTLVLTSASALAAGTSLTIGSGETFVFDRSAGSASGEIGSGRASPALAAASVPEAGTLGLLLAALGSAAIYRRFHRQKALRVRCY
jgi:autotransporter-associated beta strand protein